MCRVFQGKRRQTSILLCSGEILWWVCVAEGSATGCHAQCRRAGTSHARLTLQNYIYAHTCTCTLMDCTHAQACYKHFHMDMHKDTLRRMCAYTQHTQHTCKPAVELGKLGHLLPRVCMSKGKLRLGRSPWKIKI